jgi:hypothetical protein
MLFFGDTPIDFLLGAVGFFISGPLGLFLLLVSLSYHGPYEPVKVAEDVVEFAIGYLISAALNIPQLVS